MIAHGLTSAATVSSEVIIRLLELRITSCARVGRVVVVTTIPCQSSCRLQFGDQILSPPILMRSSFLDKRSSSFFLLTHANLYLKI